MSKYNKKNKEDATEFKDTKDNKRYILHHIKSDYIVAHCRVLYFVSFDGKSKQQFTDLFFEKLIRDKKIIV